MIDATRIIQEETSSPELILRAMAKEIGYEWVNWQPESVWAEIRDELGISTEIPRVNKDKIMALKLCIKTNVPWDDWRAFIMCVLSFNNVPIDAEIAQEASPAHMAYGVRVLTALQPEKIFSSDVQYAIAGMLMSSGICWTPQDPLGEISNEAMEYLIKAKSNNTEAIAIARDKYMEYKGSGNVYGGDVHTTRLVAIDQYLQHKEILEERMS